MSEVIRDDACPWGTNSAYLSQDIPPEPLSPGRLSRRLLSHRPPDPRPATQAGIVPTPVAKRLAYPFRSLIRVVKQRAMKKTHPEPAKIDPAPLASRVRHCVTPSVSLTPSLNLASSSTLATSSVRTPSSSFTLDSRCASRLASPCAYGLGVSPWLSDCTPSLSSTNPLTTHATYGCPHIQHFQTTFQQPCVCVGQPMADTYPISLPSRCGVQSMFYNHEKCPSWAIPPFHPAFDSSLPAPSSNRASLSTLASSSIQTPSSSFTLDSGYASRQASSYAYGTQSLRSSHTSSEVSSANLLKAVVDAYPSSDSSLPTKCGAQPVFSNREQSSIWPNLIIHPSFDYPHPRCSEATVWPPHLSDEQSANPDSKSKTLNRRWTQDVWGNQESGMLPLRADSPVPLESTRDDTYSTPQEVPRLLRMPDLHDYIPLRGSRGGKDPSTPSQPPLTCVDQHLVILDTHLSPVPTRYDGDISKRDDLVSRPDPANFEITTLAQQCEESQFLNNTPPPANPESYSSIYLPVYANYPQGSEVHSLSIGSSSSHKPTSAKVISLERTPHILLQTSSDNSLLEEDNPVRGSGRNAQDYVLQEHETVPTQQWSKPDFLPKSLTLTGELLPTSMAASRCPESISPRSTSFAYPSSSLKIGSAGSQSVSRSIPPNPASTHNDLSIRLCPQPSFFASSKSSSSACIPRHDTCLPVPKLCAHPVEPSSLPALPLLSPQCTLISSPALLLLAIAIKPLSLVLSTELLGVISQLPLPIERPVKLTESHPMLTGTCRTIRDFSHQKHEATYVQSGPRITALQEPSMLTRLLSSILSRPHTDQAEFLQIVHTHVHDHRQLTSLCTTASDWRSIEGPSRPFPNVCIEKDLCFLPRIKAIYIPTQHGSLSIGLIGYSHRSTILGGEHDSAPPTTFDESCTSMLMSISPVISCNIEYQLAASFLTPISGSQRTSAVVFGGGKFEKLDLDPFGKTGTLKPWEIGRHAECAQVHSLGGAGQIERNLESKGNHKDWRCLGAPRATRQGIMGSPPPHRRHLAFRRLNESRRPKFKSRLAPQFRSFYRILSHGLPNIKGCSVGFHWEPGGLEDTLSFDNYSGFGNFPSNLGSINGGVFQSGQEPGSDLQHEPEVRNNPLQLLIGTFEPAPNIPTLQPPYHDAFDSAVQQPTITPSPPIPLPANSQYNVGVPEWIATKPVPNIATPQPRYYDGGNSAAQLPASPPNPAPLSASTESNVHGPAWNEGFVAGCEFISQRLREPLSRPHICGSEWNAGFVVGCMLASRTLEGAPQNVAEPQPDSIEISVRTVAPPTPMPPVSTDSPRLFRATSSPDRTYASPLSSHAHTSQGFEIRAANHQTHAQLSREGTSTVAHTDLPNGTQHSTIRMSQESALGVNNHTSTSSNVGPVRRGHSRKKHKCEYTNCGKEFSGKYRLDGHVKRDHLGQVEVYGCRHTGCNKFYANQAGLRRHCSAKHHESSAL